MLQIFNNSKRKYPALLRKEKILKDQHNELLFTLLINPIVELFKELMNQLEHKIN